jgi:hypothetical protein
METSFRARLGVGITAWVNSAVHVKKREKANL